MTYQDYLKSPYATPIKEADFTRLQAYATIGINHLIKSLVPMWVDTTVCAVAIEEVTVMQIAHLQKNDVDHIASGKEVKSESLDGYSRSYADSVTIGGMSISLFAQQHLLAKFMDAGLMYKGVSL